MSPGAQTRHNAPRPPGGRACRSMLYRDLWFGVRFLQAKDKAMWIFVLAIIS
jgi:hypothetical protein